MESPNLEIIEAKNTKELYLVASQFCTFMENIQTFEMDNIIDYLLKIFPLMYLKGSLIQEIELDDDAAYEQFVTEEEYEVMFLKLKEKINEIDFFEFFNFQENENQTCSTCEILADMYQEMKDFILLFNKNTLSAQEIALFMQKNYFMYNWGKSITILLPYLHQLKYQSEELEQSED